MLVSDAALSRHAALRRSRRKWSVIGASAAVAYDARRATVMASGVSPLGTAGVSMSVLPAGSSYDPATGRAALP